MTWPREGTPRNFSGGSAKSGSSASSGKPRATSTRIGASSSSDAGTRTGADTTAAASRPAHTHRATARSLRTAKLRDETLIDGRARLLRNAREERLDLHRVAWPHGRATPREQYVGGPGCIGQVEHVRVDAVRRRVLDRAHDAGDRTRPLPVRRSELVGPRRVGQRPLHAGGWMVDVLCRRPREEDERRRDAGERPRGNSDDEGAPEAAD